MRYRRAAAIVGLLTLCSSQMVAQTVEAGPEWTKGRSGGWGRGDRDPRGDNNRKSDAPRGAMSVVVPANVAWTTTRIRVTRGQQLRFEPSGEIRISLNRDDVAVAAGAPSGRMDASATMPSVLLGTLIGRINSGKPFSIGNTTQAIAMPASGTLFLAVNDDHVADNSGNYVVKVWERTEVR